MNRYRKKPVEIEAMQLLSDDDLTVAKEWIGDWGEITYSDIFDETVLLIRTLEGPFVCRWSLGYWVIKGVEGEFYGCKDSIFHATYDPVEALV